MSAIKREAVPELYWRNPDCPLCGEEVSHDGDCYCCETCDAHWPEDTGEGAWSNYEAEQCASTHQPLARNPYADGEPYQFEAKRCLLDVDHQPPHRHDAITEWTDETAVSGLGPSGGLA